MAEVNIDRELIIKVIAVILAVTIIILIWNNSQFLQNFLFPAQRKNTNIN